MRKKKQKKKKNALLISELDRWVITFTLRPLLSRVRSFRYTFDRRLGGPRSRYDAAEKIKIPTSAGNRTLVARNVATHYTSVYPKVSG
jgi:hypothetical protein